MNGVVNFYTPDTKDNPKKHAIISKLDNMHSLVQKSTQVLLWGIAIGNIMNAVVPGSGWGFLAASLGGQAYALKEMFSISPLFLDGKPKNKIQEKIQEVKNHINTLTDLDMQDGGTRMQNYIDKSWLDYTVTLERLKTQETIYSVTEFAKQKLKVHEVEFKNLKLKEQAEVVSKVVGFYFKHYKQRNFNEKKIKFVQKMGYLSEELKDKGVIISNELTLYKNSKVKTL